MKPIKAIALLAPLLGLSWLILMGTTCLSPLSDCKFYRPNSNWDLLAPILFVLGLLTIAATVVLYAIALSIRTFFSWSFPGRVLCIVFLGAAMGIIPPVIAVASLGGQGIWALYPQALYLPFCITGALFGWSLDRLINIMDSQEKRVH